MYRPHICEQNVDRQAVQPLVALSVLAFDLLQPVSRSMMPGCVLAATFWLPLRLPWVACLLTCLHHSWFVAPIHTVVFGMV